MFDEAGYRVDKGKLRRAFERAASRYDQVAVLQREVGSRMLERLALVRFQPRSVLDVGAGTGICTLALAKRYRKAPVIALDIAPAMLQRARKRASWFHKIGFVGGDAESLPLGDACFDLLFSNLTLQWCVDLPRTLGEFLRVLKPGGLLMFTTFGPDTLKELRASWAAVDAYSHVNLFFDMHDIGDTLLHSGFAEPVMDVERFTLTYPNVYGVMRDLKQMGAHNVTAGRPRSLTGKRRLQAMAAAYESERRDGKLPATFEVVYGHAWAPEQGRQRRTAGDVRVSVASLLAPHAGASPGKTLRKRTDRDE